MLSVSRSPGHAIVRGRHLRAAAAVSATVLLQLGCAAVGPTFERPAPTSPPTFAAWHGGDAALAAAAAASAPSTTTAARWRSLSDPVLDRLLALAATGNLDLFSAATRVLEARALEASASAQHGPQVGASAGVGRQRQSEDGAPTRLIRIIPGIDQDKIISLLSQPFTLYQGGFDASWELDLWGRVRRNVEAAQAQSEEARADAALMRLTVTAELVKTYHQLRSLQSQLALAREEVRVAREAETLLEAQVRGGLIDDTPLVRQRLQDADALARVESLTAQEAAATNRLTLLCGQPPGALNAELAPAPVALARAVPDLSLGLPSEMLRGRPDIAAAEARLAAATANVGVAVADLYPRVTIGATFGFEALHPNQITDWGSRQWSIGPSLSVPVFDHGRRRSVIELRERQQQEAAIGYQQTVLKAWHEVDDAISAYVAETRNGEVARQRVRDAEEARAISAARYTKGMTDYLPSLAADQTLLQARRAQAESAGRVRTQLVAVYKALGSDGSLALETAGR
ncbi:MAG TPA: efflux transporter outer membrane subunit [Caldimonas sp.]